MLIITDFGEGVRPYESAYHLSVFVETRCLASLFRGDPDHETRSIASLQKHRREAEQIYKNTDAKHRVSTKTQTRGIASLQKHRREASRLYKNTDARHRVSTKTQTRSIATETQTRGIASLQKHRREASRLYKNTDARHSNIAL